jgi:hypothetical protein
MEEIFRVTGQLAAVQFQSTAAPTALHHVTYGELAHSAGTVIIVDNLCISVS